LIQHQVYSIENSTISCVLRLNTDKQSLKPYLIGRISVPLMNERVGNLN